MKTAFHLKFMLELTVMGFLAQAWPAQAGAFEDAEDSPLYAASMKNAFAGMLARDQTPTGQAGPGAGGFIAVEGAKWHIVPAPTQGGPPGPPGGSTKDPLPRDITVSGATCLGGSTCQTATCYPNGTCVGSSTCTGTPTCFGYTCGGSPTCDRTCGTTCYPGNPTCNHQNITCYLSTCDGSPTCYPQPTCLPAPTCAPTCNLPRCSPPSITGVNIPRPGQFQFSFYALGQQVSYHVLYCTNLDLPHWTDVFSMPANNTTVTFTHTNNAPRAYYRLSIQNL